MPSMNPGPSTLTQSGGFDVYATYEKVLKNEELSVPLAAILTLVELIEASRAGTMFELVKELNDGAETLKKRLSNPISLNAGCELFIAFVTLFPHDSDSFAGLKTELVQQGKRYAAEGLTYRKKIAELCLGFIKDDSVILTHSYSRVVVQTLVRAHQQKRISVYVTEARPHSLGTKTYEALTAAGIPCTVVLDSAVAYVMEKVDMVLVGSEAIVESGGLINAVGSNQIAIIAKSANKPFYALAESFKFHRLFPLSQYDLPSHKPDILSFRHPKWRQSRTGLSEQPNKADSQTAGSPALGRGAQTTAPTSITQEEIFQCNPDVDYTRPDLISLVFSDVGSLTPEGVSQYLVGMFAG
ncbi:hypothetical protein HGRIS_013089 [Hohenbuehelia grisea]|uniref:Translation initiation factor eIF2B subunit alpha n=1 Tax=Hohenbuehelia grisea TaxID=104357 RepID=A0ABR3IUJ8_9AGAR